MGRSLPGLGVGFENTLLRHALSAFALRVLQQWLNRGELAPRGAHRALTQLPMASQFAYRFRKHWRTLKALLMTSFSSATMSMKRALYLIYRHLGLGR